MPNPVRFVLLGLGVVLLQWLVFNHLRLWGAYADVVLLFVALVAVRYGRAAGTVAGFTGGLLMDLTAPGTPLGLFMTLKTLLGFVIGVFRSEQGENLRIYPPQAAAGAFVVTLVHNGLMVIVLALGEETRNLFLVTGLWLGSALYTAAVAFIGALFRSR
ncbi:MAG TPA: rod shape-determining protein MreD [Rubricoccaceae bacterium]|nr:rod shape-determining protein MreD [Rubricoccaceae bacterium]